MTKQTEKTQAQLDAELEEEFDNTDLGDAILRSVGGDVKELRKRVVRPKSMPTSINLPVVLVERLKEKAAKRHIGYQTMLKIIVSEHLEDY